MSITMRRVCFLVSSSWTKAAWAARVCSTCCERWEFKAQPTGSLPGLDKACCALSAASHSLARSCSCCANGSSTACRSGDALDEAVVVLGEVASFWDSIFIAHCIAVAIALNSASAALVRSTAARNSTTMRWASCSLLTSSPRARRSICTAGPSTCLPRSFLQLSTFWHSRTRSSWRAGSSEAPEAAVAFADSMHDIARTAGLRWCSRYSWSCLRASGIPSQIAIGIA
mmetsp:Transcript_140110/g.314675  ORF Transcript_140110/g.314675 Transcript_140110/m.314675 type:complete len:228 (+) Transcript_140110:174-857(+)